MEKLKELYSDLKNKFAKNTEKIKGIKHEIKISEEELRKLVVDEYSLESLREKKRLEDDLKDWKTIEEEALKERAKLKGLHGKHLWNHVNKISNEALTSFEAQAFEKYSEELEIAVAEVTAISNKWQNEVNEYVEGLNHTRTTFVPFAEKMDHNFYSPFSPSAQFKIRNIIEEGLRI